VAEWTAETEVLFALMVGSALTTELMAELAAAVADETTGVVVASAVAGYSKGRMLLTSAGIDAYQPGGLPAASAELMSAAKADGDAMAELRASLGSAVASTIRTDCDCSGLIDVWAPTPTATAATNPARNVNCISYNDLRPLSKELNECGERGLQHFHAFGGDRQSDDRAKQRVTDEKGAPLWRIPPGCI